MHLLTLRDTEGKKFCKLRSISILFYFIISMSHETLKRKGCNAHFQVYAEVYFCK
jgi:hypothetical protein